MKKLKYLLFLFVIFITPNVFAAEFNMNSYTSAALNGTKNRYRGTEIYNTGMSNTYTFNTQYNGRLSDIEVYFDYPFSANTTYRFTYNMNTDDFRNNFSNSYWWDCGNGNENDMTNINAHVVNTSYINMKKVQVSLTPSANTSCIRLWLRSTNLSSTAITGVSNWRLNNITIYDPDWQNGTTSGSGSQGTTNGSTTGSSASNPNGAIIDNANQNTQNIIDNANQNTQDIINSNKVCETIIVDKNYPGVTGNLSGSGNVQNTTSTNYLTTDFIDITNASLSALVENTYLNKSCFYDINKNFISCLETIEVGSLDVPTNAKYIRVGVYIPQNKPVIEIKKCKDGNQSISDSITDSNVDSSVGSDFFDDFQDNTHGLTSIITAPLNAIQSITSSTCQPLSVPIPFTNSSVSLPCMSQVYEQNIPTIYNIWKIVSFGIIAYFICIDIFHIVKGFKDPESDKVEVLDL